MNKRIRILAEEAGFCTAGNPEYFHAPRYDGICTEELEEFARLIMKECAGACNNFDCSRTVSAEYLIMQHFGVENA